MKKLFLIGILLPVFSFGWALKDNAQLHCRFNPNTSTVDGCVISYAVVHENDSRINHEVTKGINLTAGQTTSINGFLAAKVTWIKTQEPNIE